ncbi:Subtilase family protein [Actinoplanes derwentensis]|uniref:Subtilase family protein n=3 Tax=Actinoplanes derwentensis TaxID=113562 RepID=A0A1H2C4E9_9ACTN|nr:Subtilase family protein [Actinoplanes derwentensis]
MASWLFISVLAASLMVSAPAFAAPGQNCAEPGRAQITGSYARVMLQADEINAIENGGGTTVAVLATGVDAGQPQLGNRVLDGADVLANAGRAGDDCTGLGTQVAGVISGQRGGGDNDVAGLSPGSRILPVRVMPDDPAGSEPTPGSLARGIDTAVQNGADVIVVAAPVRTDQAILESAVADAVARGVIIVAAVGERARDEQADAGGETPYPAGYRDVIGVGAIDRAGQVPATSRSGDFVDLVAPGVAVPALQTGRGLVEVDGTAVAAGFVAASAALLRARRPDLTVTEVTDLLRATASPTAFGTGVVNPYAALTARTVDAKTRQLPALKPAPLPDQTAEAHRRTVALTSALLAAILVLALLLTAAALRRSRRRQWRPALAPHLHARPEPLEPGPPVMLLDPAVPQR